MNTRWGLAAVLAASALLISGCAGTAAPGSGEIDPPASEPIPVEAVWLDEGRALAVVTWGSSSCVPLAGTTTASGQHITVTFADPGQLACTMDYAPRASFLSLPDGVDPKQNVTLTIVDPAMPNTPLHAELRGQAHFAGHGGGETNYEPSAGSFGEDGVVLLSWGSSSCPPVVESIAPGDAGPLVSFMSDTERMCTADMAPRLTVLSLGGTQGGATTLILNGDSFDMLAVPILDN